jgi:hypothetical protein
MLASALSPVADNRMVHIPISLRASAATLADRAFSVEHSFHSLTPVSLAESFPRPRDIAGLADFFCENLCLRPVELAQLRRLPVRQRAPDVELA